MATDNTRCDAYKHSSKNNFNTIFKPHKYHPWKHCTCCHFCCCLCINLPKNERPESGKHRLLQHLSLSIAIVNCVWHCSPLHLNWEFLSQKLERNSCNHCHSLKLCNWTRKPLKLVEEEDEMRDCNHGSRQILWNPWFEEFSDISKLTSQFFYWAWA